MPTYYNDNTTDVYVESLRLPAKESKETEIWIKGTLPSGVTKTADTPSYNPVLLCSSYTSDTTITVPAISGSFSVEFYVVTGSVDIRFNVASMTPPITLYAGQDKKLGFHSQVLNDIRLDVAASTNVIVTIWKD